NISTGAISGMPTVVGTSTVTLRVQDSGSPQQSAQKSFDLTITGVTPPPSSCGTGATNCLTVANAPSAIGGTFVPDPTKTSAKVSGTSLDFDWEEEPTATKDAEGLTITMNSSGSLTEIIYAFGSTGGGDDAWSCLSPTTPPIPVCVGFTVDRKAGTATFSNVVIGNSLHNNPPITLNGTLTFTPF
ncbi:MAG TPA: hypothetical protein VFU48_06490, partial [Nitrospira sp.]|nr:hypothetical protein [Nitrospira sp.]